MSSHEDINLPDAGDYMPYDEFSSRNNEANEPHQFLPAESPVRESVRTEMKQKGPLDTASSESNASRSKRPMFTITPTKEFKRRRQSIGDLQNEVFTLGHQVEEIREKTQELEKRADHHWSRIDYLREAVDGMKEDDTSLEVQREVRMMKRNWATMREEVHDVRIMLMDGTEIRRELEQRIDGIDHKTGVIEDLDKDVGIMKHHLEELHDQVTNLGHHRETIQEVTEREQENNNQIITLGYKLEELQARTGILEGRTERNVDRINFISEHVEGIIKYEVIKEIPKEVDKIKERVGATREDVNELGKSVTISASRIADLEQRMESNWDQRIDRIESRLEELAALTATVLDAQASILRGDHLPKKEK